MRHAVTMNSCFVKLKVSFTNASGKQTLEVTSCRFFFPIYSGILNKNSVIDGSLASRYIIVIDPIQDTGLYVEPDFSFV